MLMLEAMQKALSCLPLCPFSCPWPSLPLWPNPKDNKHKKQHDHPRSAGKYCYKQYQTCHTQQQAEKSTAGWALGVWTSSLGGNSGRWEAGKSKECPALAPAYTSLVYAGIKILCKQGYRFHITYSNGLNLIAKVIPLQRAHISSAVLVWLERALCKVNSAAAYLSVITCLLGSRAGA